MFVEIKYVKISEKIPTLDLRMDFHIWQQGVLLSTEGSLSLPKGHTINRKSRSLRGNTELTANMVIA